MPSDENFPETITTTWIAQQEFPYGSLVNYIIHLLTEQDYEESELPIGLDRLWLVCRLESDVSNGGFGQFFGNAFDSRDGSDRFLRATLPAVRALGLDALEPFVAETIQIHGDILEFERRYPPVGGRPATAGSACGIGPINLDVEAFQKSTDSRFEELYERWGTIDDDACQRKLDGYIKTHLEEFVFSTETAPD